VTTSATIRQADAVVRRRQPSLNAAARQIALAIGLLESGYGVDGSWVFEDGTKSYNWGALVGKGTAGSIDHGDKTADGAPTSYLFKAFRSMDEGFDAFFATWSRGDISGIGHPEVVHETTTLPPASRGDARGVATTMYAHGYYTGVKGTADDRIDAYANAIVGAARTVANAIGEPLAVTLSAKPIASSLQAGTAAVVLGAASLAVGAPFVAVGAIAVGTYWLLRRMRS